MSLQVAIDIGGTSARVATFASQDSDRIEARDEFEISGSYQTDLRLLTEVIQKLVDEENIAAVAIATAGTLDEGTRMLTENPNVSGWVGKPLIDDLEKALGCEVRWLNDAEAAGLAEGVFGPQKERDFWFVIWGTGVGATIVRYDDDAIDAHATEAGHHVLRWETDSPECACGKKGCMESFVGGASIEKRFGKPAKDLTEKEWDDVCDWMARGLYNLVRAYPVDRVVLGGGVANKQANRLPEIEALANELLVGFRQIKLGLANHEEDAGLVGAHAALRDIS